MRYVCLVYFDEQATWSHPEDELMVMARESGEYNEVLEGRGQLVLAHALQPAKTAVSVRRRDGKTSATDGPFAETKEVLGGFLVVEARDLNEAIEIAGRVPLARFGTVEVRPVLGPGQDPRTI
jgi:hypothetical protein